MKLDLSNAVGSSCQLHFLFQPTHARVTSGLLDKPFIWPFSVYFWPSSTHDQPTHRPRCNNSACTLDAVTDKGDKTAIFFYWTLQSTISSKYWHLLFVICYLLFQNCEIILHSWILLKTVEESQTWYLFDQNSKKLK